MRRAIILLTLLLAGPSLASAQETFNAASGSFVIQYGATMEPFTVAGPGFSASGTHLLSPINPLNFPYPPGVNTLHIPGTTSDLNLTMDLTVRGVPFGLPPGPDGGEAQSIFHGAPVVLSGRGPSSVRLPTLAVSSACR
jgi:hypothetical protein